MHAASERCIDSEPRSSRAEVLMVNECRSCLFRQESEEEAKPTCSLARIGLARFVGDAQQARRAAPTSALGGGRPRRARDQDERLV